MFGGVPTRVHIPPEEAMIARGIKILARFQPWLSAIPKQTGINTATVPVLDRKADIAPVIIITAINSLLSEPPAILTAERPIFCARPVWNIAPPTTNIPPNKITLESIKPEYASFIVIIPEMAKYGGRTIAAKAIGIASVMKKKATTTNAPKVNRA